MLQVEQLNQFYGQSHTLWDLDLNVVSGSIECEPGDDVLRDRLYLNDGRGDFSKATTYGVMGSIRGEITLNRKITFYARWGDVLGRISLFIAGLLLLRSIVKKILPG